MILVGEDVCPLMGVNLGDDSASNSAVSCDGFRGEECSVVACSGEDAGGGEEVGLDVASLLAAVIKVSDEASPTLSEAMGDGEVASKQVWIAEGE